MMITQEKAKQLAKLVGYKGRKEIKISEFRQGMSLNSYWSGGSRDYFFFVNLVTGSVSQVRQNGTPYDRDQNGNLIDLKTEILVPNTVLVNLYCYGSKQSATIYY